MAASGHRPAPGAGTPGVDAARRRPTSAGRPVGAALDRDRVVRHVLAKQHLLSGSAADSTADRVVRVADDVVGLHATSATSPYLSLHARLRSFVTDDLDRELYRHRSLVRLKGMRGTVFMLSRRLAPIVYAATREVTLARDRRWLGLRQGAYDEWAPRVVQALEGRTLSVAELRREMGADADLSAVVALLCDEGRVVRDHPAGGRKSNAFRYRLWDEVFPAVHLAAPGELEATRTLVRLYLTAYGPATLPDVVWWSGIPAPRIREAVSALGEEIVEVLVHDLPGRFLVTEDDLARLPAGPRAGSGGVALLPELDPYTMGYRDRERYLDPRHRELVFDRGGNATSVVLAEGRVVGVWDLAERPERAVRLLLFDPEPPERGSVLERSAAVGRFWFGEPVPVLEYASMLPLTRRSGVIRRPLDGAQSAGTRGSRGHAHTTGPVDLHLGQDVSPVSTNPPGEDIP